MNFLSINFSKFFTWFLQQGATIWVVDAYHMQFSIEIIKTNQRTLQDTVGLDPWLFLKP